MRARRPQGRRAPRALAHHRRARRDDTAPPLARLPQGRLRAPAWRGLVVNAKAPGSVPAAVPRRAARQLRPRGGRARASQHAAEQIPAPAAPESGRRARSPGSPCRWAAPPAFGVSELFMESTSRPARGPAHAQELRALSPCARPSAHQLQQCVCSDRGAAAGVAAPRVLCVVRGANALRRRRNRGVPLDNAPSRWRTPPPPLRRRTPASANCRTRAAETPPPSPPRALRGMGPCIHHLQLARLKRRKRRCIRVRSLHQTSRPHTIVGAAHPTIRNATHQLRQYEQTRPAPP